MSTLPTYAGNYYFYIRAPMYVVCYLIPSLTTCVSCAVSPHLTSHHKYITYLPTYLLHARAHVHTYIHYITYRTQLQTPPLHLHPHARLSTAYRSLPYLHNSSTLTLPYLPYLASTYLHIYYIPTYIPIYLHTYIPT